MPKLTDKQIRQWIKDGERFEGRSDGGGLTLRYRENFAVPVWRYRYKFAGKARVMEVGSYTALSLAAARKVAKELSARVALGYDVAAEKQERKREALAKIEAKANARTVADLADEYFERMILTRWKHPNIVRSRIEKDIKPNIGKLTVDAVKPMHIDAMLQSVVDRGAPTVANDVLRWVKRMFDFGIKRHYLDANPASAFNVADAGGKEKARDRWLSRDELATFFKAMETAKGFSKENELTLKLLLLLAVRTSELREAPWSEFNLDKGLWELPAERTKTEVAIVIPLPDLAVEWLCDLKRLGSGSDWVLPARKAQHRMLPYIHEGTLSTALGKVKHGLPRFTVHDLRRTARTHIQALGVPPHVAERCLNHKIKGVAGIYDRYDYFEERRGALNRWARLIKEIKSGEASKVVPIRRGA